MNTLASALPSLVTELRELLLSKGREELISKVERSVITRCTLDRIAGLSYLYLHRENTNSSCAETINFLNEFGTILDVDEDGTPIGIEIVNRPEFFAEILKLMQCSLDNELCMGNLDEVRQLLEQGEDVDYRDGLGFTPLMTAAHTGQPDAVRLLLQHNADPDIRNREGRTARAVAERLGHHEVLEVFDEFGIA